MSKDRLSEYALKRDFRRSPEPEGSGGSEAGGRFVVQRHDASNLHFDFRLQVGDVLASWSVPKGPSPNPSDKRLAIRTEDHPLDYAEFEGTIPRGEYGAGTVVVWDTGDYDYVGDGTPEQGLDRGELRVRLRGAKLSGVFALARTRYGGEQEQWLLIKKDDEGADRRRKPAKTQPESVLSGQTSDDLEQP